MKYILTCTTGRTLYTRPLLDGSLEVFASPGEGELTSAEWDEYVENERERRGLNTGDKHSPEEPTPRP